MFSETLSSVCATQAPDLHVLDLYENLLSGKLPNCWKHFQGLLPLNLAGNNLSGKLPRSLGYLMNIISLRLHDNSFSGEFPYLENCTELVVVDLGANKLSGKILAWIAKA
ncbi:unnamed protein product [Prunus armeniaca]